jgi:hypothetical protein
MACQENTAEERRSRSFPLPYRPLAHAFVRFDYAVGDACVAFRINAEMSRAAFGDTGPALRLTLSLRRRVGGLRRDQGEDGGSEKPQ